MTSDEYYHNPGGWVEDFFMEDDMRWSDKMNKRFKAPLQTTPDITVNNPAINCQAC